MAGFRPLSDRQWERIRPWAETRSPQGRGRPPVDTRTVLDAVLYVLQTGEDWDRLPKDFGCSGSTTRRAYIKWVDGDDWPHIWAEYIASLYDEDVEVFWETMGAWLEAMSNRNLMVVRVGTGVTVKPIESRWI